MGANEGQWITWLNFKIQGNEENYEEGYPFELYSVFKKSIYEAEDGSYTFPVIPFREVETKEDSWNCLLQRNALTNPAIFNHVQHSKGSYVY